MGKRSKPAATKGAKKFAKLANDASASSGEALLRRRVIAQRTRLSRQQQRLEAKKGATPDEMMAYYLDGSASFAEAVTEGDELAEELRLKHLAAAFDLLVSQGGQLSQENKATAGNVRVDFILALLNAGEAGEARDALERLGPAAMEGRERTPLAFSRALLDFIDWRGGVEDDGDTSETDKMALGGQASASLETALASNPYVGIFISSLPTFVGKIDPADLDGAAKVTPAADGSSSDAAAEAAARGSAAARGAKDADLGSDEDEDEAVDTGPRGKFEGSVEECMAYMSVAAGCWMDFLEAGIDGWVADGLERFRDGDEESGGVLWPPRRCSTSGARFQQIFMNAAKAAEEEAEADSVGSGDEGAGGLG